LYEVGETNRILGAFLAEVDSDFNNTQSMRRRRKKRELSAADYASEVNLIIEMFTRSPA
jgi:hypothetical protein